MPKMAHWTITLKYPTSGATAGPVNVISTLASRPVTIDVVKVGKLQRIIETQKDGKQNCYDQEGDILLLKTPSGFSIHPAGEDDSPYPFFSKGFLFTEWVRDAAPSTFKGQTTILGQDCFHYQDGSNEVWVARESKLPVKAVSNGVEVTFRFLAPPESQDLLPPDEAAYIKDYHTAVSKLNMVR